VDYLDRDRVVAQFNMQPLKWPLDWATLTPWQRVLLDAPLIGVRHRVFKDIIAQIQQRPQDTLEFWGDFSPVELDIKQKISKIAVQELRWPNSHFLPSDPFEIIMWDGTGDLATAAALDLIEKEFGLRRRSDGEWQELASHALGYVVQKIASELPQEKP
jgi:hypothetical protein